MDGWRRGIGVALLVVGCGALGRAGLSGCTADSFPSTLTWDGEAFVAAWAAPEDGQSSVYVVRFKDTDFGPRASVSVALDSKSRLVMRAKRLVAPPEVVSGADGFLVLAHTSKGELLAASLDRRGHVTKPARPIARDVGVVCVSPIRHGNGYAAAWTVNEGSDKRLRLAMLDGAGNVVESHDYRSAANECALGGQGDRIGLISREPRESFFALRTLRAEAVVNKGASTILAMTNKSTKPLRILALEDGWAMMFGDGSEAAMIVIVDDEMNEKSTFSIDGIDPVSLDLAKNDHGVFATWIAEGHLRMVKLSDLGQVERDYVADVARDAQGTRSIGFGDRCATSWTSDFGRTVTVLRAKSCRAEATESDRAIAPL